MAVYALYLKYVNQIQETHLVQIQSHATELWQKTEDVNTTEQTQSINRWKQLYFKFVHDKNKENNLQTSRGGWSEVVAHRPRQARS